MKGQAQLPPPQQQRNTTTPPKELPTFGDGAKETHRFD
jgi:hypothetical protein